MPPARASLARTVLTSTLTVVAVVVVLYLIYLLRTPLSWLGVATFLAVALSGPVNWLNQFMSRGRAIALTYLALLLIPAGILALILPPLVREITGFLTNLPEYAADTQEWVQSNDRLREIDQEYDITQQVQDRADELTSRVDDAATWLGDLGLGIVNSAFAALTILILSIFIVSNGRRWVDAALALGPPERAAVIRPTLDRMGTAVGAFVAGALFQALVAGITTYVVLTILGVPFAAPLAVLFFLLDLIPLVGATIAAVVVGIITLFADFPVDTIVWVVWAIIYQQIENNIIQPRIQNRAVGVHPLGVIVAVLFGGTLYGIPGAILAVPVAAMIQIGVRDWWRIRREQQEATAAATTVTKTPVG